eukprot:651082-Prymnesium_polylepis.2
MVPAKGAPPERAVPSVQAIDQETSTGYAPEVTVMCAKPPGQTGGGGGGDAAGEPGGGKGGGEAPKWWTPVHSLSPTVSPKKVNLAPFHPLGLRRPV